MAKAKTIDRLEYTLKRFPHLRKHKPDCTGRQEVHHEDSGLKVCPQCGAHSLRLDGGCMSCLSCGWSACG